MFDSLLRHLQRLCACAQGLGSALGRLAHVARNFTRWASLMSFERSPTPTRHDATVVVVVVADVRLHGEGVSRVLSEVSRTVVKTTTSLDDDMYRKLDAWQPDVVLLDAGSTRNLLVAHRIARDLPRVRVVAFSDGSDEQAVAYAEAGVLGFLEPQATPGDLNDVVEAVARREACYPQRLVAALVDRVGVLAASGGSNSNEACLTRRETQIIELIENGLSNRQIAAAFQIELATVKNHVHNILRKLGVHSRGDAAVAWRTLERT